MNAQDTQDSHTDADSHLSKGEASKTNDDVQVGENLVSATEAGKVDERNFDADRTDGTDPESPTQPGANSAGVDASKLQRAIDNLVSRIAEARSHGAARNRTDDQRDHLGDIDTSAGFGAGAEPLSAGSGSEERIGDTRPQAPSSEHYVSALELRMRQIADLAGPHPAEHLSVEIDGLRGKIDRLSRLDGVLTGRLESLQQQMSELRGALDKSSVPVIDRLSELEARLDEIGEALASRQLTGEARAAVEHSCSHLLGAIARIEDVARQAAPPKGTWERIAATRDSLARMPTVDDIAVLEKRILAISEKLVEVAEHGNLSDELAGFETRLTDVVAATKVAVNEIRERPTLDYEKIHDEVYALLKQTETRIGDKLSSGSGVDVKIDAIARKVDRLSQADNSAGLSKVQNGLTDLANIISAQSTHLSRLDLAGLQHRLAKISDKLAAAADEVFEPSEPPATTFSYTDYAPGPDDDEDREAAKQLAIRLAPNSLTARAPRHEQQSGLEPTAEDVSGAFAAVRDALEALLGQVPYVEGMSTGDGTRTEQENERPSAPEGFLAGSDESGANPAGPYRQFSEFARQTVDRMHESEAGEADARTAAAAGDSPLNRSAPRDESSKLVAQARDASAGSSGADQGNVSTDRPESEPDAASLKLVRSTEAAELEGRSGYSGAVDTFGTFSTWRRAKVAIVNANTPKD